MSGGKLLSSEGVMAGKTTVENLRFPRVKQAALECQLGRGHAQFGPMERRSQSSPANNVTDNTSIVWWVRHLEEDKRQETP